MIQLKLNPNLSLSKPAKAKSSLVSYSRQHFDANWSVKKENPYDAYHKFVSGEGDGEHLVGHYDPFNNSDLLIDQNNGQSNNGGKSWCCHKIARPHGGQIINGYNY